MEEFTWQFAHTTNTMIMLAGQSHIYLEILSGMSVQSSWLHSWTDFFGGEHHAWKHSVWNVYIKLLTWNDMLLPEES